MMDFPGVLSGKLQPLEKLAAAQLSNRRIDGHAPDLSVEKLNAYIAAGASSDHECWNIQDAIAKLERGRIL